MNHHAPTQSRPRPRGGGPPRPPMNRGRAAQGRHRYPRRLRSRHFPEHASRAVAGSVRLDRLPDGTLDWPRVWAQVERELRARRYAPGTLLQYRQVLRSFRAHIGAHRMDPAPSLQPTTSRIGYPASSLQRPASQISSYLHSLGRKEHSWSWIAANISVLRAAFDKLGGLTLTASWRTPRRPQRLPDVLSPEEALQVRYARGTRERHVALPQDLLPVLREGVDRCAPEAPLFPGSRAGRPLRTRSLERVVRTAAAAAGLGRPCTAMTLRHSYAAHCLTRQASIRALQEALGHACVETTLVYARLTPPAVQSPADRLPPAAAEPPDLPAAQQADPLFENPLSVNGLDLPFPVDAPGPLARALAFCRLLRTRVREGFLAFRRAARTG